MAIGAHALRVLVVEDDEVVLNALRARIEAAMPDAQVSVAASFDQAISEIDGTPLDAAVIDLRIPPEPGKRAEVDHGKAVESRLSSVQPGAFRVFLTASNSDEVIDALRYGKTEDFLAEGADFCIVDYVLKEGTESLDTCLEKLLEHRARLDALDGIPLDGVESMDLDSRRAIAVTVRTLRGVRGRVVLQEGLSESVTALVECIGESGVVVGNAFCKTGPPEEIEREVAGWKFAQYRLPSTSFPALARQLAVGVGRSRSLIFTKAPTSTSFYEVVRRSPEQASEVIGQLRGVFSSWTAEQTVEEFEVAELVRLQISPAVGDRFKYELAVAGVTGLSGARIELPGYLQHGDLHGKNLFVTDQRAPFLVDFAHTRVQHGPVDPVSLELSMIFHPSSPVYGVVDVAVCDNWFDASTLEAASPLGAVAKACRRWCSEDGYGTAEHALATLLYALWILNHTDAPRLALALAEAAVKQLSS